MHTKEITFSTANERHTDAITEIGNQIRSAPMGYRVNGISIRDILFPDMFRFVYEYSVRGRIHTPEEREVDRIFRITATIDQKVIKHLEQIRGVVLICHAVGSKRRFLVRLTDGYYPPELIDEMIEYELRSNDSLTIRNLT